MKFPLTFAFALALLLATSSSQSTPFDPCPAQCSTVGLDPSNWTYLHGERALRRCNETTIFDTALYTPVNGSNTHVTFRACKASQADTTRELEFSVTPFTFGLPQRRRSAGSSLSSASCIADVEEDIVTNNTTDIHFLHGGKPSSSSSSSISNNDKNDIVPAAVALADFIDSTSSDCSSGRSKSSVVFAHSGNAVVGLYIGREIYRPSALKILRAFIEGVESNPSSADQVTAAQVCGGNGEGKDYPNTWIMGIYADPSGDIASIQEAVRRWSDAKCLTGFEHKDVWKDTEISLLKAVKMPQAVALQSGLEKSGASSTTQEENEEMGVSDLNRRQDAECRAIQAAHGDGCASLALRCGVSQTMLKNYNKNVTNFCDTLQAEQWVCCSPGVLPDFSPKPNPDGSCATYTIQHDDICFSIADTLNKNTWGWAGCDDLQVGQRICLSSGDPPMPAAIQNAVCGPQVPGTSRPTDGTELKDLNPCPLKACCNIWGQCGLTSDFCIETPADTGAPGTSRPGANGCVSNCGMEIVRGDPPASFSRVAYFEAWNKERACLHMDITNIDTDWFTHIHFAFGDITPDFKVDVSPVQDQFDKLLTMSGSNIKRILSFGGWAFSVERPTYTIFREGVTPENRLAFANNVVNFINEHDLEGVDFDWEYPAAPDLPNIPPGIIEEGKNYLEFLKMVKRRLPNKSVSIAAPASYWYLKGYPIEEISKVVDYIIYMTYDLHGQWDYGNKWSSEGCPEGNCLRSHVNITETRTALSMITKAGVPARKVFCGIASYGRSFRMAKEGCTGPECHFTGTNLVSDAAKGVCTDEGGYIAAAEIREIIGFSLDEDEESTEFMTESWHDGGSNSDILVYDGLEWVAWMSDTTKRTRSDWYKQLGFGGTSDWAVDLDRYGGGSGGVPQEGDEDEYGDYYDGPPYVPCDPEAPYETLEDLKSNLDSIPDRCLPVYISQVLLKLLNAALDRYHNDVNQGYDSKFASYAKYMKKAAPKQLETFMDWITGPGQEYFDCDLVNVFDNYDPYKGSCPVPYDRRDLERSNWELEYTLTDEEGFYNALLEETGLDELAIEFGFTTSETPCYISGNQCAPHTVDITNSPLVKEGFEPPNPKDIVEVALTNMTELKSKLILTSLEIAMGRWEGSDIDVILVLSMPVFMVMQAVEAMEEAKEIGEEIEEAEERALILGIISAVLFFIPLGGPAAAMLNMPRFARMISMAGLVGEAGLALVDIIDDPTMAPLAIFGVLSEGKLRTPKSYKDAADNRRLMTSEDLGKLGEVFKKNDDALQDILSVCTR
ncbi:hypothetical protein BJX63DRAFT_425114 [Aspergillus granulosus]|uniref:chitinase n=1 Tax=Aspergillus granulosus TaxID=176169 RepID=A0ABR4GYZ8_9EURO